MKKLLIVLLFSYLGFGAANTSCAQNDTQSVITTDFNYIKTESAFLFTDNSTYIKGDKILYKVFVWGNADSELQELSNVAFILFKNSTGKIIEQQKILISNGEGNGDITLSDSLTNDIYTIEVYTKWMQNFSETPLSLKNIWVSDLAQHLPDYKDSRLSVSIVPEGGNFLADNKQNKLLIYPAIYHPEGFRFELFDPDGIEIQNAEFNTFYGVTTVRITKTGVYSYRVCFLNSGKCTTGILSTSDQPSFKIEETIDGIIKIIFRNFERINQNAITLLGLKNGEVILSKVIQSNEDIIINGGDLEGGEIQIMLLNKAKNIVAFQSFYNLAGKESNKLNLVSEKVESVDERNIYLRSNKNGRFKVTALVQPKKVACYLTSIAELKKRGVDVDILLSLKSYGYNVILKKILSNTDFEYNNYRFVSVNDSSKILNTETYSTPIDLLLSGFDKPILLDSIIYFKSQLERVRRTYDLSESTFQKINPDKSFVPDDYTEIKNTKDFLDLAIPNLHPAPGGKSKEQVFSFTNLKQQKSYYPQPPIVCLNGFILPSIKSIYDFPLSDISSIDIVFNAQSIFEQGVKDFFPNGVIFFFTKNKLHPLVQYSRSNSPFFSKELNWPSQFSNNYPGGNDNRIPRFKSVYNWYPTLTLDDKTPILCNTPEEVEREFYLTLIRMSDARDGVIGRIRIKK